MLISFFRLIANLIRLVFLPVTLLVRKRRIRAGSVLAVVIDGAIAPVARRRLLLGRSPVLAFDALARVFDTASRDRRVSGVLVTFRHFAGGGAASASLRELLLRPKAAGKRVVSYLPNGANSRELYAAVAADELILGPASTLGPLGFAVTQPYFARALERLGVEAEVLAHGRYKTAGEQLRKNEMSPEQREQLGQVLEASASELQAALRDGRRVPDETARGWLDAGMWSADRALEEGIADAVLYEDELPAKLGVESLLPWARYAAHSGPLFRPLRAAPRLSVIEVSGVIVARESPGMNVAAEPRLRQALTSARENRRVLGVLLAINSRGGSALASERIWREVQLTARVKPVVAYLSDVAASGGYMIAAGADCIVAEPLSITGSIGVVSGRLLISGLLERVGVRVEVEKRGDRADMFSALRPLDAAERQLLEQQLGELYRHFVGIVAEGRRRSREQIESVAEGRVWSGRQAFAHGLVDRLGGLDVAVEELRGRIGPAARRAEVVLVGARRFRGVRLSGAGASSIGGVAGRERVGRADRAGARLGARARLALVRFWRRLRLRPAR